MGPKDPVTERAGRESSWGGQVPCGKLLPQPGRGAASALTSPRKAAYRTAVEKQRSTLLARPLLREVAAFCPFCAGVSAWRSRCAAAAAPNPRNSTSNSSLTPPGYWSRRCWQAFGQSPPELASFQARRFRPVSPSSGDLSESGQGNLDFVHDCVARGRQSSPILHKPARSRDEKEKPAREGGASS
ncbi:hypothetical protein I79_012048 [Cricetulus griseus]|uniref:Uncharacterized protein n=1 Tax=Cricetulus griseus TaxID=10029 RepID=G3HMS6_CRIGR|nr:hypothetical protein I79_012048 [Cricetulus griseus]